MPIATFSNFNICVMGWGGYVSSLATSCFLSYAAYILDKLFKVKLSIETVHLWNFFLQFFPVSLRETSHDKEFAKLPLCLSLSKLQNGVYTFLFCVIDESASIDYSNFAIRALAVVSAMVSHGFQLPHKILRVNEILRASKCYYVYDVFSHYKY